MRALSFDINLLRNMKSGMRAESFRKGQVIFSQGDRSDTIFYVDKGMVKLTVSSIHGKEAVIAVLNSGSFIGENALAASPTPRSNFAVALNNVRALAIDRHAMLRLLHSHTEVCDAVISSLIGLKVLLQEGLADNLLYSSEQRLARTLVAISKLGKQDRSQPFPKLSQQDFANMIGVTRQRVNMMMRKFHKQGLLDYAGGLRVHSSLGKIAGRNSTRES